MDNLEAWTYISTKEWIRNTALEFVKEFQLEENEFDSIWYIYRNLKPTRDSPRKSKRMEEWETEIFYPIPSAHPLKKRILDERNIVESDLSMEIRKPLSQLTLKEMPGIISGAGGAHSQLSTSNFKELKDLEMVRDWFPINRQISDSIGLLNFVDREEYLSLPSSDRLGITHEPVWNKNILPASPLQSYTCVFRWYMLLIYHLQSGKISGHRLLKQSLLLKNFAVNSFW